MNKKFFLDTYAVILYVCNNNKKKEARSTLKKKIIYILYIERKENVRSIYMKWAGKNNINQHKYKKKN
jgi:hypothetical protein